jgi:hypothetical protein
MLASTPEMRPPTLTGDFTTAPYAGLVRLKVVSSVPTTSHGRAEPVPQRTRWTIAEVEDWLVGPPV